MQAAIAIAVHVLRRAAPDGSDGSQEAVLFGRS
jgi:hypothetical protein